MVFAYKPRFVILCAVVFILLLALIGFGRPAHGQNGINDAQASKGAVVYAQHCALCHGADLLGSEAPPLVGPGFGELLEIYPMTARQLFEFVTSHMPYGGPGQLGDAEYLEVFSFILHLNGYPIDNRPLTKERLNAIPLLPHPATGGRGNGHP